MAYYVLCVEDDIWCWLAKIKSRSKIVFSGLEDSGDPLESMIKTFELALGNSIWLWSRKLFI